MNPLKARDLLPKAAKDLDLPQDMLRDLTDFYWSTTHKAMTSLDHLHILAYNLGTFSIKGDIVLDTEISKIKPMLEPMLNNPPRTPMRYKRFQYLKEKYEKLHILKSLYFKNKDKKAGIRLIRSEIRKAKKNLEEPGSDS